MNTAPVVVTQSLIDALTVALEWVPVLDHHKDTRDELQALQVQLMVRKYAQERDIQRRPDIARMFDSYAKDMREVAP